MCVPNVLAARYPFKVVRGVVLLVGVAVIYFGATFQRRVKRKSNQTMDQVDSPLAAALIQVHCTVATIGYLGCEHVPGSISHAPFVADLVAAFIAGDILPGFHFVFSVFALHCPPGCFPQRSG